MLVGGDLRGQQFTAAYAEVVDTFLASLLDEGPGLALVAVGGYGRAELCPGSDIDVVLLHHDAGRGWSLRPGRGAGGGNGADVKQIAERLWYPLWDSGLKLGHAVRTVKEAVALAADDLKTATALLDVRLIAGDASLADDLAARARAQWESGATRWLKLLADSVAERHQRTGEVAFMLEPDLKEGRGGLRDVHALRWAEAARRVLVEGDDETLEAAYQTLLGVRIELQRRTGRATDQLLLQEQDGVAATLAVGDADDLMALVATAARTVAWTSDEAWRGIGSWLQGPAGRAMGRSVPLGEGLVLREGTVDLTPAADVAGDLTLAIRAAAGAAGAGVAISRSALKHLTAEGVLPDPATIWPDEARRAWLRLLGAGAPAIPVLEALDQAGLLVRLFPEWEAVRCRPQRNAYHRFTVDRHLTEAAARAAGLADRVGRPDLLLVAAWLHDIGKGFTEGGKVDHSIAGMPVAERILTRLGFPTDDIDVVVTLVRFHLLLSEVATRRDVDDPATAAAVAEKVKSKGTLELLHALSEADAAATGPAAWSPWKAGLINQLVANTEKVLSGEEVEVAAAFPTEPQLALAGIVRARESSEPVVDASGLSLTVVAADQPGLFCRVAGTLTLHGLDVLTARAWSSDDGVAVDEFLVEPLFGGAADWPAFESDLGRVLSGRLSLDARVAERSRAYANRHQASAAPPRVRIDNRASQTATVVEVHAPDRIGTLYRITRALADLQLDIRSAKVATLGPEVVDAFYVVDASGTKIDDVEHQREVERAVLLELSRL